LEPVFPSPCFTPAPSAHGEPFLAIKPLGPLAVHHETLLAQQHVETPVAEPSALASEHAHALS
jgi:hypothetical protein